MILSSPIIALCIAVLAGLWIASGLIGDADGTLPHQETAVATQPPRVQVKTQTAEPFQRSIILTGRTEASRRVELRSQLEAQVNEIHAEKGALLLKDAPILSLDIEDRAAQVTKSQALLDQRWLEYDAARKLADKGHRAENTLAAAQADYAWAQAELARRQADLSFTTIKAPFDGILDDRRTELGDYLRNGDVIGVIIDLDPILIVAEVPENEIRSLRVGMMAKAALTTGEHLQGMIRYISSISHPTTRTFRIEIEAPNPDNQIAEGVTAKIHIPSDYTTAHHISPAILTLDDSGVIGVKTVGDDHKVQFYPIEIVGSAENGMWLTGLPQTSRLITVGQEFVMNGQTVTPVEEKGTPIGTEG